MDRVQSSKFKVERLTWLLALFLLSTFNFQLSTLSAQTPISTDRLITNEVQVLTPALVAVSSVNAQVLGNGGSATYYYWIVAKYAAGNATPSNYALVISAPNTLSASNRIRVTWGAVAGATGYDVLRTTTAQLPNGAANIGRSLNQATTSYDDTGGALVSYTVATLKPRQLSLQLQSPYMDLLAATPPPVSSLGRARYYFDSAAGQMMVSVNGAAYVPFGAGAGSGIKTLNALSSVDQFLVTCTNGLDFNIADSIDTHSFCIPDASATARGLVTTGAQVFDGNKTFLGDVTANSVTTTDPNTSNAISEMDCSTLTPTLGLDIICADQTAHAIQFSNNGGAFGSIPTGFPRLDQVLDPTADKTFAMTDKTLGFTWGAATGAIDMLSLSDSPNNTGTGNILAIHKAANSNIEFGLLVTESSAGGDLAYIGVPSADLDAFSRARIGGVGTPLTIVGSKDYSEAVRIGYETETGLGALAVTAVSLSGSGTNAIEAQAFTNNNASFIGTITSGGGNGGAGTVDEYDGIVVFPTSNFGGGQITANYGIRVHNQTLGVSDYAIGTGLGQNSFGDRLTVKSNAAAVQPVTFTGAGLNDATSGGAYTGLDDLAYCVQIDASVPSPDTFEWGTGGSCSNGATGVGITGVAQNLSNGVQITFAAIDGHTIGDNWTFTAYAPIPLTLQDHNGNITAKAKETGDWHSRRYFADTGTALVAGDFVPSGGWGATGSVAVTSASTDQSFHITVTGAGGGYGLNPTVAFTFKDGTWTTVPIYTCSMETGGTGALSFFTPDNTSATVLTLTYAGTPGAATYKVACNGWGQ